MTTVLCADLEVTKTDSPDPVGLGENLTYTVVVTNNGPGNAQSVVLTDMIPANTTFVSNSGAAGWMCMNPPVNGTGTITCTIPTLVDGAMATFTIVVKVNATACGATITNTATVSSATPEQNTMNNTATTTTTTLNNAPMVNAGPDQSVIQNTKVTLSGSIMDPDPGQMLTFMWTQIGGPPVTLTMTNTLMPMFMAPSVPVGGCVILSFKLTVTDPCGDMAMDTVTVTVEGAGSVGLVIQDETNGNCLRIFPCNGTFKWRLPNNQVIMGTLTVTINGPVINFQGTAPGGIVLQGGINTTRRTGNARLSTASTVLGTIVDNNIDNNQPCP